MSKNTDAITLPAEAILWNFTGCGEVFHALPCSLVSRSKWRDHISSMVTYLRRNFAGSLSYRVRLNNPHTLAVNAAVRANYFQRKLSAYVSVSKIEVTFCVSSWNLFYTFGLLLLHGWTWTELLFILLRSLHQSGTYQHKVNANELCTRTLPGSCWFSICTIKAEFTGNQQTLALYISTPSPKWPILCRVGC